MLALAEPQERAIRHRAGPLLLIGEAGTGKSEVLARRFAGLVEEGTRPERILVLATTRATAGRLRSRVEQLLDRPLEELWIGTWETLGERLLRDHATAAGLDPMFGVLGRAERLALLLDRIEELPLRHQQIRGNPAGLLARLIEQIDELKSGVRARATPSWSSSPPPTTASSPPPAASTATTSTSPSAGSSTSAPTSAPSSPTASNT